MSLLIVYCVGVLPLSTFLICARCCYVTGVAKVSRKTRCVGVFGEVGKLLNCVAKQGITKAEGRNEKKANEVMSYRSISVRFPDA